MVKKHLKASLPHLNRLTAFLLIVAIMIMSAAGALMVRLEKGPLNLEFAKPHIEAALSDEAQGYQVKIGSAALIWPEIIGPLLIETKNVRVVQNQQTTLSVDELALGLSGIAMIKGKIRPSTLIVTKPTFDLIESNGKYNLFWQETLQPKQKKQVSIEKKNGDVKVQSQLKDARQSLRQTLDQITNPEEYDIKAFSAIKKIQIKNAEINIRNLETQTVHPLADLNVVLEKNSVGLVGDLNISLKPYQGEDQERKIKASVNSEVVYRKVEQDLTFTGRVQNINPAAFAEYFPSDEALMKQNLFVNGQVRLALDKEFKPLLGMLNVNIPNGELILPEYYEEPLNLKDIKLNMNFDRPKNQININEFSGEIDDLNFIAASKGTITNEIATRVTTLPLDIKISTLKMDTLNALVPKTMQSTSIGEWLTKKLYDGVLKDISIQTNIQMIREIGTPNRDFKVSGTKAEFLSEGLTIQYSETLMPVKNAYAKGVYENDTLTINGNKGMIGDVAGSDVVVKMTDLSVEGGGYANITLKGNGPFKTVLKYASDEPIALGDTIGFDIEKVKGNIAFDLALEFPTVKDLPKEKVIVKIDGKLTDVTVPAIVQGLDLTGGPYDLKFADGAISLKGKGLFDGRTADVDWFEYLDSTGKDYETLIKVSVTSDADLRDKFGIGLTDYISGPIPLNIVYTDYGVKAKIDVIGDLTPATLHIDPFSYKKAAGVKGDLSLRAIMKNADLQEVDNLKISAPDFSFENGRIIFRKFKDGSTDISRGEIPKATLGKSRLKVDFEVSPANVMKIVASASTLDISPFINTDKKPERWTKPKEAEQPMTISVTAANLIGDSGKDFGASKIYLESDKQGDITRIEMDASIGKNAAGGTGSMVLRFRPDAETGVRTFRLEATDAGATLKAFGLYDKIEGGTLNIYGQPQKGDLRGNLYGSAKMENFRVRKAPALAKLLSVMSLKGVQGVFNSEGLTFEKLESDFEWKFNENGNLLVMKDGRTSGSALGLTFEGVMNQGNNTMDVSGTVIPLSGVNKAIGKIPVLGTILTGGDALLAATYSVKGPAGDPNVSVNPLSVLAPGFLRKIFFEGSVDAKVKKQEAANDNTGPVTPAVAPLKTEGNFNKPVEEKIKEVPLKQAPKLEVVPEAPKQETPKQEAPTPKLDTKSKAQPKQTDNPTEVIQPAVTNNLAN